VGREAELGRLNRWLTRAMEGMRQVVFVTGEPGVGKTTVVDAFMSQAAGRGNLRSARGQCVEHFGAAEVYLPVLEALGQLCRQPGARELVALLARHAPTWLAEMPALLDDEELEAVKRRVQGTTRERMLRELAEALEVLAAATPLVLVIEDLQWSDFSTLDLISLLAQRRGRARLLVLGTYRPADAVISRHPIRGLKQELQVRGQCEELALGCLTAAEVTQYLASRFPTHNSLAALGQLIHQTTDGNPLFMVNVVDYWLNCGVLVETDGQWRVAADVADARLGLPESLRQMIEKQLERLTPQERRVLEAASVAGREFSTSAVAAAVQEKLAPVEEWCEGLSTRGQFLRVHETETMADGTLTSRYRFIHALYQQVVYERTAALRQVRMHRQIGEWEEHAYGSLVRERAAQLAVHFERGHDYQRAVRYLDEAARNALRRSANREVVSLLTKALELLKTAPDTPERSRQELTMLISLGASLSALKGYGAREVENVMARALELCRQMEKTSELFFVLLRLAGLYMTRGEMRTARELGEQCLSMAQGDSNQDPLRLLWAHYLLGEISFWRGEFVPAKAHLEQGLSLYTSRKDYFRTFRGVDDPAVSCLLITGMALWFLGYPDQAVKKNREALSLAQELANPLSVAAVLHLACMLHQLRGELRETQERLEVLKAVATEQEFPLRLAGVTILRGWLLIVQAQEREKGLLQMRQGLTAFRATGTGVGEPWHLSLLAQAHGKLDQVDEGLAELTKALAFSDSNQQLFYEAELYRLNGELLLQSSARNQASATAKSRKSAGSSNRLKLDRGLESGVAGLEAQAEAHFLKAIEVARQQHARSLELRAVMSLARLFNRQGKAKAARQMLAGMYGQFTEGFDTADLKAARALLDERSIRRSPTL
jgi:tetratricopeptide (TPR) repeat protein